MVDWPEIAKGGISAGWGLVGVIAGSWAAGHHHRLERRNSRINDQLMEFYAPLRGMHADIKAKSDLRSKIETLARDGWQRNFIGVHDPEARKQIDEREWPRYEQLKQYSDDQLRNDIIPTYRKMLEHFTSHMAYSEESTIAHYPAFVEFVEIWNRFLAGSLPREIADGLSHAEKNLYPLYDDIEINSKRLSEELQGQWWLHQKLASPSSKGQIPENHDPSDESQNTGGSEDNISGKQKPLRRFLQRYNRILSIVGAGSFCSPSLLKMFFVRS